jgi:uncharacterized protein (DUF433 family)
MSGCICGSAAVYFIVMSKAPRIIADPDIMMGKPVIEGTRITVELILTRLAEGRSVDDIVAEYPHVSRAQVTAAIEYARDLLAHPAEAAE